MLTVPISPSADPALKLSELTLSVVEDKASCYDRGRPELASLRTGCVQENRQACLGCIEPPLGRSKRIDLVLTTYILS
jgi:hypothetical protein